MKKLVWIVLVAALLLVSGAVAKHGSTNNDASEKGKSSLDKVKAKLSERAKAKEAKQKLYVTCVKDCNTAVDACKKKCGTRKTASKSCTEKCTNDRKTCMMKC